MKTTFRTLRALFPACVAAAGLLTLGCSDSTTHKDVAKAKQNLDEAQQKTADTIREGQKDIANAQQGAREHLVAKPVTPEENAKPQQDIAEARHDSTVNVADAKEKERAAAAELKTKQQQLQATQERDAFVKDAEQKLANYDKRIDELKQQASTAEGANKDAINRQIDTVKKQRDLANKAISDLKGADLATWKNHQDHVRMAFQDLDNSMKSVR